MSLAAAKPPRPLRHPADRLGPLGAARRHQARAAGAHPLRRHRAAGADRRRDAQRAGRARRVRLGGGLVSALQTATSAGMRLVFGYLAGGPAPFETVRPETSFILAFQALPLILVISALSKLLYHWGILQRVVHAIGWVLQRSLGVTGPVGTSAAANVFVGMVEAPLLVRPYLASMSRSGLFATMTVGMAGVAGTVLALYATVLEPMLPGAAGHLIVASVISVPAALMLAELMVPDGAAPDQTAGRDRHRHPRPAALEHGRHRAGHARGHRAARQRHGHADRDRGAGGARQPAARLRRERRSGSSSPSSRCWAGRSRRWPG